MKKIYLSMMAIAIAAFTFTACEDVPEPYNNPYDQLKNNPGGDPSTIYSSEALNTGWTPLSVTADQPWITGSSYAQATGYQKWDGASDKSNKAVEGWLISPAISTVGYENVKLSFDNTIRYTNNVSGWADNHKIYASTSFDGTNASTATWTELNFTPVASTYSDWTLYSSGEIQLPAEFVGKETVYIGFWFKAPAGSSTTWELKNFKMEEGIAGENNTDDPNEETIGTKEEPITVVKALELINGYTDDAESPTDAYVKGTIVSIGYYDSNHKSLSYYISDDGTATNQLQVYSGKGLNGADIASKEELKAGAVVVVKGKLKKYMKDGAATPEINQGSKIISIENNGGGNGNTDPTNESTIDNPYSVTKTLEIINSFDDNVTTTEKYYVKGKVTRKDNTADEIGPNSTKKYKDMNYFISEDGTENNELYIYRGKFLAGADFTDYEQLKVGDEVVVYGKFQKYIDTKKDNAVVCELTDSKIVKLNGEVGEGSNDNDSQTGSNAGVLDGSVLTLTFSSLGLANQEKVTTLTLIDGTTLTFADGGNKSAPAYYNTGTALRMYPKNSMVINAGSKKIAAIEIACDNYQGTLYNASGDISVGGTKMTVDGDNLKYVGPNESTTTIANVSETTGAPSQLRMKTLIITYSE